MGIRVVRRARPGFADVDSELLIVPAGLFTKEDAFPVFLELLVASAHEIIEQGEVAGPIAKRDLAHLDTDRGVNILRVGQSKDVVSIGASTFPLLGVSI